MKTFLPVLIYQKIGLPPPNSRLKNQWTTLCKLERMLMFLVKHGYHFITPKDLQALPPKPILLVFMGGYQSFYTDVFPLLQKHNAHAICAVAVETLGTYNSWQDPYQEPWQNILTASQLNEIAHSGLVQIATLGLTGNNLLQIPCVQAKQEVVESIYRLKNAYHIDACALAFWPTHKCAKIQSDLSEYTSLPVITPLYGINSLNEKKELRILRPTWLTRLRLYLQK